MVTFRAMTEADVPAAVAAFDSGMLAMLARHALPVTRNTIQDERRRQDRTRHFLGTDPDGSWVAEEAGTVVGMSQSFVREGYWMLSMLGTQPGCQGRGIGADLLELALSNASRDCAGTIQSSRDPSAMALYTMAGFALHPALRATGPVRPGAVRTHPSVRTGDRSDIALVDDIDRFVRGSARGVDIEAMLADPHNHLLLSGDRGYAVALDDRLVTLGARNEETAAALLESAMARAGGEFEIGWLTGGQQWAIRTAVGAGLRLNPHGAVMVRGMPGPPWPYIPSGGYG